MKNEDNDPILFSIVFQLMLGVIILLYSLTQGPFFLPPISIWPRFLLGGILYAAGTLCSFYASKSIPAGEKTILITFGSIITVFLGVFLLGNSFSFWKAVGVALILLAVFILYGKERMKMSRGVWYALGVALFFSLAVVNDVIIMRSVNIYIFLTIMCFLPGMLLAIAFPKHLKKLGTFLQPRPFVHIGLYSLIYSVSAITYYQALNAGALLSQLSPINNSSIIITVFFAALFLGERSHLIRKIVSAIVVTAGVLLLA